ncbi:hypothetical protein [Kallotenue papyrolyticum]|uniref:hypothetical protein n=1 Tax=Kallotenue papyrolyticum TaxID=1325125 RepID=UPI0004729C69|nr:hypothetical protein [Kallotenue papyrolyticum]
MPTSIIVVDSDAGAAQITKAILRQVAPEAQCQIVPDPVRAWLLLRRRPAELIIIDPARYPQVARRMIELVRTAYPSVQLILLSAVLRYRDWPHVHGWIDKQLPPAELRRRLQAVLGGEPSHEAVS